METLSALLALCVRNSPVYGEFPSQRPVTRSFDVFFDLRLNKRLSKRSWGWWFETPSHSLWRHCDGVIFNKNMISFRFRQRADFRLYNICLRAHQIQAERYRSYCFSFRRVQIKRVQKRAQSLRLIMALKLIWELIINRVVSKMVAYSKPFYQWVLTYYERDPVEYPTCSGPSRRFTILMRWKNFEGRGQNQTLPNYNKS